jgi:type IV pilus assembly protein PilX
MNSKSSNDSTFSPLQRSRALSRSNARQHQRGVVLIIALIVLVSMTLAAIGMSRSVDTANVVAGNLAFKQGTVQGADTGLKAAYAWLVANSGGATLQSNGASGTGYYASLPVDDPDWFDPNNAVWGSAAAPTGTNADTAGNVVKYVIHRMCSQPDAPYNGSNAGVANQCALTFTSGGSGEGSSMAIGSTQPSGDAQLYYRVTARVDGPRNTVSIVQMSVLLKV